MKFGLIYNTGYYGTDPDQLIAVARHAEACGFESFYVTEEPVALMPAVEPDLLAEQAARHAHAGAARSHAPTLAGSEPSTSSPLSASYSNSSP